jgi:hypothetical protein
MYLLYFEDSARESQNFFAQIKKADGDRQPLSQRLMSK